MFEIVILQFLEIKIIEKSTAKLRNEYMKTVQNDPLRNKSFIETKI